MCVVISETNHLVIKLYHRSHCSRHSFGKFILAKSSKPSIIYLDIVI